MANKNEERGNALDAAPKGPRLPGKKKIPPPLPKEPAAAPTTTPEPEPPDPPVSEVPEIKEFAPVEKPKMEAVLAEMKKQGFKPMLFAGAAAETPTPAVGDAPAVVPTTSTPAPTGEDPAEAERQIELTLKAPPPQSPTPSSRMQLAASVVDFIAAEMRQEKATSAAPPASKSSTRMLPAESMIPAAEALAAEKEEEAFFARGERIGRHVAPPRRVRPIVHNHYTTITNPAHQETDMSHNVTSTSAPAPAPTPTSTSAQGSVPPPPNSNPQTTTNTTTQQTTSGSSTTNTKKDDENKPKKEKIHQLGWLAALVAFSLIAFFVGTQCPASTGTSNDTRVVADTTSSSTSTASARTTTRSATTSAPATTASATFSAEHPVSQKTESGSYTPTNALLAEVAAANGGKWHGDVSCYYTDWTPIDDSTPWVDCSGQKKRDITGPKPDCFKVTGCKVIVP